MGDSMKWSGLNEGRDLRAMVIKDGVIYGHGPPHPAFPSAAAHSATFPSAAFPSTAAFHSFAAAADAPTQPASARLPPYPSSSESSELVPPEADAGASDAAAAGGDVARRLASLEASVRNLVAQLRKLQNEQRRLTAALRKLHRRLNRI